MGRRVSQKLHEVITEGVRAVLTAASRAAPVRRPRHGARRIGRPARLERIQHLARDFPDHVACTNGRLEYYETLMRAADYNAMTSLYEPHGGAFEGAVVPIVRLVDGLARQVNALEPTGRAATFNAIWHEPWELPSGLGFREPSTATEVDDLRGLLTGTFAPRTPRSARWSRRLPRSSQPPWRSGGTAPRSTHAWSKGP